MCASAIRADDVEGYVFDPDVFVREVRMAANAAEPVAAVQEIVATAIIQGVSIDGALGTTVTGENDTLFVSESLTVQRIQWVPGLPSIPHEHRMWAIVGVYTGEELNRIYERSFDGLREARSELVSERSLLVLDSDAIHSVENPGRARTAALHVYGGDILKGERNGWGPDGREAPFADIDGARRAMFAPMRDLTQSGGKPLPADVRYRVLTALLAASEREKRYLTADEAREIIAATSKP
jgi:predicted metal-dependent enzyme (double-stranded beta helix superfamily)